MLDIKAPLIVVIFILLQLYSYKAPFKKVATNELIKNITLGLLNFALVWNLQKVIGLYLQITPSAPTGFSPLKAIVIVLSFDLLSYAWHRANHSFGFLWRWHKFHHTPEVIETSTAFRFHPVEIVLAWPIKATLVALLGASATDLIVFEVLFQSSNLFQHSNFKLPKKIDTALSKFIITPSQHRLHHSILRDDQHKNLSTIFNVWDKIFRTQKLNDKELITMMGIAP